MLFSFITDESSAHLDQHVPQWQEVAVLQVLNVNDAPGIFSSAALFPSLTLDYRVGANNSKRNTLLFGEENHVHVAVVKQWWHLHPPVLLPLSLLAVLHLRELVYFDLGRRNLLHDHRFE